MNDLSIAEQQIVAIAKSLSINFDIIIMDEPTASLSKKESLQIYKVVNKLKEEGKSIIYISHRLEDIYKLADRMTVIRDGRYIGTYENNGIKESEIIKMMVGKNIDDLIPKSTDVKIGREVLRVEKLRTRHKFKNVSFYVRAGEIISIAGLVGSGRTKVCEAICGLSKLDDGDIFLDGKKIKIKSFRDAIDKGIGLIPDDRQKKGLILSWSINKNLTIPNINRYSKLGFLLSKDKEKKVAEKLVNEVEVKATSVDDIVNYLSGGNQQKVVVAKAFSSDFKVVIMDDPTKGVDVGAKSTIYTLMGELVKKGVAIILLSSEMKELIGMSDRIYVMKDGRINGELNRDEFSQEKILELEINESK